MESPTTKAPATAPSAAIQMNMQSYATIAIGAGAGYFIGKKLPIPYGGIVGFVLGAIAGKMIDAKIRG